MAPTRSANIAHVLCRLLTAQSTYYSQSSIGSMLAWLCLRTCNPLPQEAESNFLKQLVELHRFQRHGHQQSIHSKSPMVECLCPLSMMLSVLALGFEEAEASLLTLGEAPTNDPSSELSITDYRTIPAVTWENLLTNLGEALLLHH